MLNMYNSLMEGNNQKVYDYLKVEYAYNPFDIATNQSMMVIVLQFINRPELADAIFEEIPSDDLIVENCLNCEYRIYVKSMADIQLEKQTISLPNINQWYNMKRRWFTIC